jgi:hypothetical protein
MCSGLVRQLTQPVYMKPKYAIVMAEMVVSRGVCGGDSGSLWSGWSGEDLENDAFPVQCFELICYKIDRSWAGTMCDAISVLEVVATVETESTG